MIKIFSSPEKMVNSFAKYLVDEILISSSKNENFSIALSGGNTPQLLFKTLSKNYKDKLDWSYVHIYWGDERCVSSKSSESNYGIAKKLLLNSINIPNENIYNINGEEDPHYESIRYSNIIKKNVPYKNNLPCFDICFLGLGVDGHTGSIFPNQMEQLNSNNICDVAIHPQSGQKRITITGDIINNSKIITFLVTGETKQKVVAEILNHENEYFNYPASHIKPFHGELHWYLDKSAGSLINREML